MKYIVILITYFSITFVILSCSNLPIIEPPSSNDANYIISRNGNSIPANIDFLSEYTTHYFKSNYDRVIYLGGKHSDGNDYIWLHNQNIFGGNTVKKYIDRLYTYSGITYFTQNLGFNIWSNFPFDSDALVAQLENVSEDATTVGDVVVFNWDNSSITGTWWDHAGIIVKKDETNPKNWLIVSSIGTIEIFN